MALRVPSGVADRDAGGKCGTDNIRRLPAPHVHDTANRSALLPRSGERGRQAEGGLLRRGRVITDSLADPHTQSPNIAVHSARIALPDTAIRPTANPRNRPFATAPAALR